MRMSKMNGCLLHKLLDFSLKLCLMLIRKLGEVERLPSEHVLKFANSPELPEHVIKRHGRTT